MKRPLPYRTPKWKVCVNGHKQFRRAKHCACGAAVIDWE